MNIWFNYTLMYNEHKLFILQYNRLENIIDINYVINVIIF